MYKVKQEMYHLLSVILRRAGDLDFSKAQRKQSIFILEIYKNVFVQRSREMRGLLTYPVD
jgi:hypothetical protein